MGQKKDLVIFVNMSHPLKKPRAVFPEEKYDPQESDDEMEQDEMIGQTINVEFMGYPAEDSDFHGIKRMIQQTFRGLEVDTSGLADTIISQNYVGSVIKQVMDDDDDEEESEMQPAADGESDAQQVFGVATVLNLTSRKDEAPIAGLRSALVEKCGANGTDSTNQLLRDILGNESKHIGLMISERLVNLPPQFALPVFESMLKEVEKAKAKKMPYDFAYVVMICKVYKEKKKKQNASEELFANPEEEIFWEESVVNFEYNVQGSGDTGFGGSWEEDDAQYIPYRRVLLLKTADIPKIIDKVNQSLA